MTFLIDGYNLLHALGLANRRMGKGGLRRARLAMLDWIANTNILKRGSVSVVFDARNSEHEVVCRDEHRGISVLFSKGQFADDLIESMISAELHPALLTVVSNDMRLQAAATRRGCAAWSCEYFVDMTLVADEESSPGLAKPIKPESITESEIDEWLRIFRQDNSGN